MTILDKKHTDWPFPFSLIPRRWTAFFWGEPKLVAGNVRPQDYLLRVAYWKDGRPVAGLFVCPITSPGTWQLSRFPGGPWFAWYFAWSGERKADGFYRHIRIGARWDDVDGYVQFPSIATRRYDGTDAQDTSVR